MKLIDDCLNGMSITIISKKDHRIPENKSSNVQQPKRISPSNNSSSTALGKMPTKPCDPLKKKWTGRCKKIRCLGFSLQMTAGNTDIAIAIMLDVNVYERA